MGYCLFGWRVTYETRSGGGAAWSLLSAEPGTARLAGDLMRARLFNVYSTFIRSRSLELSPAVSIE